MSDPGLRRGLERDVGVSRKIDGHGIHVREVHRMGRFLADFGLEKTEICVRKAENKR